ncbi:TPA: hypothetical protein HA225_06420 [Candidatus Micrarchaeota archaeon]|nr:hypothetical protein [Candidatus Micrarchaeota archaeon]
MRNSLGTDMAEGSMQTMGNFDYVSAYEGAIREVVKSCGSHESANQLLDELHSHYEKTGLELKRIKKIYGDRPAVHEEKKNSLLSGAKSEVNQIIEKHAPHVSDHVRELILGTSLVATATMMPAAYGASALAAAIKIIAIGGSYYVGFGLMRKWRALAGKHKVASYAGVMSPKHVDAHRKVSQWRSSKSFF